MGTSGEMNCSIIILILFNLLMPGVPGLSQPEMPDCFMPGLQIAGVIINDPLQSRTPSPEACQLFCQTVFDCVAFSWVDDTYSLENERLSCSLWSEVKVDLVDDHFVSGPKYC